MKLSGANSRGKQLSYWELNRRNFFTRLGFPLWKLAVSALVLAAATGGKLFAVAVYGAPERDTFSQPFEHVFATGQPLGIIKESPAPTVSTAVAARARGAPRGPLPFCDAYTARTIPIGRARTLVADQVPSPTDATPAGKTSAKIVAAGTPVTSPTPDPGR